MSTVPRIAAPSVSDAHPPAVARTAAFLGERGVWFVLGRNLEARSCRDAAHKRQRLGMIGIPLWDELKSFFGAATNAAGHPQHLIVHCRGDRMLDLDAVASAIRSQERPERLDEAQLDQLGMDYGLVNPFEQWALDGQLLSAPVLQVFDRDLLKPIGVPGTVMTNAGDVTWSVELHAADLVRAIDHAIVADVAVPDPAEPPRPGWATSPPTIGILTGNGPDSGMLLWSSINRRVRDALGDACKGDSSMPRVRVASLPALGLSMELDVRHEAVWEVLRAGASELCRDGADVIALACNTTPYFTPQLKRICAEYGAEFVSMPEVVGTWLRARDIHQVALLGVRTVSELGRWSPYREPLTGIEVEIPGLRAMERIGALAYQVKAEGASESGLNRLRNILREEVESDVILLALTELSVLLESQRKPGRSGKVLVDTLGLYADELTQRFISGYRSSGEPPE